MAYGILRGIAYLRLHFPMGVHRRANVVGLCIAVILHTERDGTEEDMRFGRSGLVAFFKGSFERSLSAGLSVTH